MTPCTSYELKFYILKERERERDAVVQSEIFLTLPFLWWLVSNKMRMEQISDDGMFF